MWQRPAAWLPQGTAWHHAAEYWELSGRLLDVEDLQRIYREKYAEEIREYSRETPNHRWWFSSGPYAGPEDIQRRFRLGQEQLVKLPEWYERHPEEVLWIGPDGKPGIELHFDIDLDGVQVRGFIDSVLTDTVRDYKTGRVPEDDFQLGVYRVAMALAFDTEIDRGDYWLAKSGKPTFFYDLRDYTVESVTEEFHKLAEDIEAERFDADPEPDKCKFCAVAASCAFSAA